MTPPNVSKRVTFRQKRCQFVISFIQIHRKEAIEALDDYLELSPLISTESVPGLPVPSSGPFLDGLTRRLESVLNDLLEAECRLLNERGNDAGLRLRRDTAAAILRQDLFQARQLLRGAYGRPQAQRFGFERRIADDPVPLLRQTARIEGRVLDPPVPVPAPYFPGIEVDFSTLGRALGKRRKELTQALDDVTRDVGKLPRVQVDKDQALKKVDDTYRWVVRCLINAFRLAGWHELAARIPKSPVYRSNRKTASDDDSSR